MNPSIKSGYYNKSVKRLKQLFLLSKQGKKDLKILAYMTDGGQSEVDAEGYQSFLENCFMKHFEGSTCFDYGITNNINVIRVILPFTIRKFYQFIKDKPAEKEGSLSRYCYRKVHIPNHFRFKTPTESE
jgi:hypothetical protein